MLIRGEVWMELWGNNVKANEGGGEVWWDKGKFGYGAEKEKG